MQRYLIQFSYFGTQFRGLQVQGYRYTDFRTVQGVLESGLRFLRPANDPITHPSSRTDTGVHALCNALHVDLIPSVGQQPYHPDFITHHLNVFFRKAEVNIRVQRTLPVSQSFNARRHASKRHYLYRLATLTDPHLLSAGSEWGSNFLPLAEVDRLFVVRRPVDLELLREGCALLQREADFATFMHPPSKGDEPRTTTKNMEKVELREGQPLMNPMYDPAYSHLQLWDILFSSASFLHNQIRRCVGTIVGLADGSISRNDIERMFAEPNPANLATGVSVAPGWALYLLKIEYPDRVLDPNFIEDDLPEDKKRWLDNNAALKTAVALGQTSIVGNPPSPVEVLAQKFSQVSLDSQSLNNIDASLKRVEPSRVDSDSESHDLESEGCLSSLTSNHSSEVDGKFSNDGSVLLRDAIVSSGGVTKISHDALNRDVKNPSGVDDTDCESALEKSRARDTDDDGSLEDCGGGADKPKSSTRYPKAMSGSKRRRLMVEAYDLLEARNHIDVRLKMVLERIVKGNMAATEGDYSEESMERLAAQIRQLMMKIQDEKIVLASADKVRPVRTSRKTEANA